MQRKEPGWLVGEQRQVSLAVLVAPHDALEVEAEEARSHAALDEKAKRARILKKRQRRNTHALSREQNRAVRAMAGLPPKEDNDD